jgi:hypothetical protein
MASDIDSNAWDGQDGAEAFDEDNQGLDGAGENDRGEMRTFEEMPDVLDVTQAAGDADDDDALIGEDLDDDEIIALEADSEDADVEDDPLAGRFADGAAEPEDTPRLAEEASFDQQDDDEGPLRRGSDGAMSRADRGDVELDFTDDTDDEQETSTGRASRFESRFLDDEDLTDLGYKQDR